MTRHIFFILITTYDIVNRTIKCLDKIIFIVI